MSRMNRVAALFGFVARTADTGTTSPAPRPTAANRHTLGWTSAERALSLSSVYRSSFIHATAAVQLGIDVERDGKKITTPPIVAKPSTELDRNDWIEYSINALWLTGNMYHRKIRADRTASRPGEVLSLDPLNPNEVTPRQDRRTGIITFQYRDDEINAADMLHMQLFRVPGLLRGLGPIQAARLEVEGALDARDYGSQWFTESGMPSGVLTTDQVLNQEQADEIRERWESGAEGHKTRVLGSGSSYSPVLLKPADVQFLESQQFSTTQIARLFGIPSGMMLAAVEGGSRTYNNILDEWRGYLQFSAMKALREIETKWSTLLPGSQRVKFNLDAFLRLDTKARYSAHREGIEGGFLTPNEAREFEGLQPIDGGDVLTPTRKETTSATA